MDRLVGVLRTENTLTARLVRQNLVVGFSDSVAVEQAFSGETGDWYKFVDCPLPLLMPGLFSQKAALLEAWETIGNCVTLDPEQVRLVLTQTVLGQSVQSASPSVTSPTQNPSVRPTAAHPRAYSGTKYQPPKPKASVARDWRSVLCDPRSLSTLGPDAIADAAAEARLPERFRTSLYPLVRQQSETEISEALSLYWAMSLDSDPERLAAVTYLFILHSDQTSRDWCRLILNQLPEQWTGLLHLLIASGADTVDTKKLPPTFSAILSEVLAGKDPFYRAYWIFAGVAEQTDPVCQIDPAYLLSGYRLADTLGQIYNFHDVQRSGYCPIPTLLHWGEYCREADDFYARTLLRLWEQCGLRPGLGGYLERTDWTQLTPNAAYRCLRLFSSSWDRWGDLPQSQAEARWEAVRPLAKAMTALLQSVPPEYQDKCVEHLAEYLWQWNTAAELEAGLPWAFILTQKLCRSPFAEKSDLALVTVDFLSHLPAALRQRFLEAPDISFIRLEQACRRDNDANLIGWGTWALTRHQSEFSVHCFESEPKRLFHAAKLLGTLPAPMRDDVVKTFQASTGETLRTGLTRLEQTALETLASGFSPEVRGAADKHALQIQQLAHDNRRALRKFLSAHWEGRTEYRQTHPLTLRWLASHPGLSLETWQTGIVHHAESEALGRVTLNIEQDPLEALKLGTYVGSCLGLGGSFAYSAAAVVLDINKQVIYARDKRGTVVGRQLVAISEDNQLVCYEVYPMSAQKELNAAFRKLDEQFASALGLTIYNCADTEDYEIAHILSHDWWDDCAWSKAQK